MKQMFTPEDFVAEVERLDASIQDVVSPATAINFTTYTGGTLLSVDGVEGEWAVMEQAHQQIAQRLQIPLPYYRRMQAEQQPLLDANVRTWLQASDERRLIRILEDRVRAFVSDRYQRIDNFRILSAVAPIIERLSGEHGAYIESCGLTDKHMFVKIFLPGMEQEIRRGDVVRAGFCIKNSETGHGSFAVQQMILTLACTNGMVVDKGITRRHVGARIQEDDVFSDRTRRLDDETIISAAQDVVEAAVDQARFDALCARMREAVSTAPSVNPIQTVEVLAKTHDLSEGEKAHVLTAFATDASRNGLGLYGLLNAVTRASQEVEDYERATELEELGGKLLNTTDREWLRLAGVAA